VRRARPAVLAALLLGLLAAAARAEDAPNSILLVARPGLPDPNFRETVVLATRHPGGGTVGVVLNRPTPVLVHRLFSQQETLRNRPDRVFAGGPVAPRALVAVFRSTERPAEALRVLADVYLSFDGSLIETLVVGRPAASIRVFVGYAGWAPGQLELELAREDWAVLPPDADTILRADPATLWRELVRRASLRPVRLSAP
jgi:putative transcriptional regulator